MDGGRRTPAGLGAPADRTVTADPAATAAADTVTVSAAADTTVDEPPSSDGANPPAGLSGG
ncbi:hypothetical protein [Geodermatophilus chilensis]|jgi:hypothetical protein|uniref:hypothetical protein n=1 Tax=Geodermatophilus chilensis TaxID=2035835 RepID=UPI000C26710A|nr:hypothetical protein [Geodermatophilus chilensis]